MTVHVNRLDHPWPAPPPAGSAIDVAPGIKWLRMPLPFKLDHINLWLLEDGAGWTAVDTGIGLEPTRELWTRVFATELQGRPISRVIVTHFHPDHMGNAGWLCDRFRVDLWCTQAEWLSANLAWRQRNGDDLDRRLTHYRSHGFDEGAIEQFRRRGTQYPDVVPTLAPEYRCLRDGDVVTIGGRRWDVFTVHGHAPEHACLWCPDARVLISGDQVLPKITTNVSVWADQPRGNPLRLYLDSFDRFQPIEAETLVLPSHGLPFHGLHARIEQLRHHHDARLTQTLDALVEPRTGVELIPVLFKREMDVHELGFAIGEVLAHVHLLESRGAVTRLTGEDAIHRFRQA